MRQSVWHLSVVKSVISPYHWKCYYIFFLPISDADDGDVVYRW
jgi:hypothetical protein